MKLSIKLAFIAASLSLCAGSILAQSDNCAELSNLPSTIEGASYTHFLCSGTADLTVTHGPSGQVTIIARPHYSPTIGCSGAPETDTVIITSCSNNGERLDGTINEFGGQFNLANESHIYAPSTGNGELKITADAFMPVTFTAKLN